MSARSHSHLRTMELIDWNVEHSTEVDSSARNGGGCLANILNCTQRLHILGMKINVDKKITSQKLVPY